jgi:hypothetical protein
MIRGIASSAVLLAIALAAASASAQCESPEDLAAVAASRGIVNMRCACDTAVPHGQYVRCASTVANEEMVALRLPRQCRKVVVKCAAKSTCGKPVGFHPCCKTNRLGKVKCKIRLPEQCRSGPGGAHCVSFTKKSCCDSCTGVGTCASPSGAFVDVPTS